MRIQPAPRLKLKPLVSLDYLVMQRIFLLSKKFMGQDPYADMTINARLFTDVPPSQYNIFIKQLYELIGLDPEAEHTGRTIQSSFQSWWLGYSQSPERNSYIGGVIEKVNFHSEIDNYYIDEDGTLDYEMYDQPPPEQTSRWLWGFNEVIAMISGELYSTTRSKVLENALIDYPHHQGGKNIYSIDLKESEQHYHLSHALFNAYAKIKGVLVSRSLRFIVDHAKTILDERIRHIIQRGDGSENALFGFDICKNNKPILTIDLNFMGHELVKRPKLDWSTNFARYNACGLAAYQINESTTRIVNNDPAILRELLQSTPEHLHNRVLETALSSDLGF